MQVTCNCTSSIFECDTYEVAPFSWMLGAALVVFAFRAGYPVFDDGDDDDVPSTLYS